MTRSEAKSLGLKRYQSETPCYRGHSGERYVSCDGCCRCTLERNRVNRGSRARNQYHVRHIRTPEQHHGLMSAATGRGEETRVPPLVDFTGAVSGLVIAPGKF